MEQNAGQNGFIELIFKCLEIMKKCCIFALGNYSTQPLTYIHTMKNTLENPVLSADLSNEIQDFLMAHYEIRYNTLTALPEFRKKDSGEAFKVLGKRELNTLFIMMQAEDIECSEADVKRFLNSDFIPDHHPMMHYMETLPEWDGQDRVTPLAHRISQSLTFVNGFHRWMLGMASQWMGRAELCANALVPILVSQEQGLGKSTFCRSLLPPELEFYYTDSLDVTRGNHVEQRLGTMALINLDEFDQIGAAKMAKLKNVTQMKTCQYRRLYTNQFVMLPRMASFIGTSNSNQLLWDPTGSRRFLCVNVEKEIDKSHIDHAQLYAQLKAELLRGERCYLTHDEEREVEHDNLSFYHVLPEEDVFRQCYRIPESDEPCQELSAMTIFTRLQRHNPTAMRASNPQKFGHTLLQMGVKRVHNREGNLYQVVAV